MTKTTKQRRYRQSLHKDGKGNRAESKLVMIKQIISTN